MIKCRQEVMSLSVDQRECFKKLDAFLQDLVVLFEHGRSSVMDLADRVNDYVDQALERIEAKRREDELCTSFLSSLQFEDMSHRMDFIEPAHEDTFHWIFDQSGKELRPWSNFAKWLATGSGTYWINGKAGSGKSTLMNYIFAEDRTSECLTAWAGERELLTSAFFFWAAGSPMQRSVEGFLRSVIYQLVRHKPLLIQFLTHHINDAAECAQGNRSWNRPRLTQCLSVLVQELSKTYRICLFLDGLDEFEGDHYDLLELIEKLVSNSEIKCCFSSRPERPFESFVPSGTLRLQDLTRPDIQRYVESKLGQMSQIRKLPPEMADEREALVDLVVRKADGVFLWVELAVKSQINGIRNNDTTETLLERLNDLPAEVEGLYSRMLDRIDPVYKSEAALYLEIALLCFENFSKGTINPSVPNFAMIKYGLQNFFIASEAISPQAGNLDYADVKKRITLTCAGLLEIVMSRNRDDESIRTWEMLFGDAMSPEPDYRSFQGGEIDEEISRETKDFRSDHVEIDWTDYSVIFCHRTAVDFLQSQLVGKKFLRDYRSFSYDRRLLISFIPLTQMLLVERRDDSSFAIRQVEEMLSNVSQAEPKETESLVSSMQFMNKVDRHLADIYRHDYLPDGSHWSFLWTWPLEMTRKSRPLRHKEKPNNLVELLALYDVYWYVYEASKNMNVNNSEIHRLASYVTIRPPFEFFREGHWGVSSWKTVDMLTHLVQLGASPNTGEPTSIWTEVAQFLYEDAFRWSFFYQSQRNARRAEVMEAFLNNRADPRMLIVLSSNVPRENRSQKAFFEIDTSLVPLIGDDATKRLTTSCIERPIDALQQKNSEQPPTIDFVYSDWNSHIEFPKGGHPMTSSEVRDLSRLTKAVLNAPDDECKNFRRDELADWLIGSFDRCARQCDLYDRIASGERMEPRRGYLHSTDPSLQFYDKFAEFDER